MLEINGIREGRWIVGDLGNNRGIHTARLAGSLDEHTVGQLREMSEVVFDQKGFSIGDDFLIDLGAVTEIDHVGLAALIGILIALSAKAGSLGLVLPEEHPVKRALQVTGLERAFDIFDDQAAAYEKLAAATD
ncbi:MAG: STAS domain-containing protein [Armatimonadetes bacterium]|nr:STAS domain-containing protein [Armatimonadota bacterium]